MTGKRGCSLPSCHRRHCRRHLPPPPHAGNPLPHNVHDVLSPAFTLRRRVLLVGDIHGCYQELQVWCWGDGGDCLVNELWDAEWTPALVVHGQGSTTHSLFWFPLYIICHALLAAPCRTCWPSAITSPPKIS